jgi:alkanesulfonate monooxygenase SsuD/methylene tetrahydromethanopterin reductase-like flavin-dependent oxidoreductase (luciferase family)
VSVSVEDYARRVRTLLGYLIADNAGDVRASLAEEYPPQVWLLASSEKGAGLAAELGLPISVAHHIRPANTEAVLGAYRERFRPSRWLDRPYVMIAVLAVCAESDERAAELARLFDRFSPDYLLVGTLLYDLNDRIRSLELIINHVVSPQVPGPDSAMAQLTGSAADRS